MSCCLCFGVAWSTTHKMTRACWRFVRFAQTLTSSHTPAPEIFPAHSLSSITHIPTDCLLLLPSTLSPSTPLSFTLCFLQQLGSVHQKRKVRKTFAKHTSELALLHCFSLLRILFTYITTPRTRCKSSTGRIVLALPLQFTTYLPSVKHAANNDRA